MADEREQVGFNLLQEQIRSVSRFLRRVSDKFLQGDLAGCFRALVTLREILDHDLKPSERIKLKNLEKDCKIYIGRWRKHITMVDEVKDFGKTERRLERAIRIYQRNIQRCLKLLGYYPPREDKTQLGF